MPPTQPKQKASPQAGYGELVSTFLRISLLGFGGPNAHLALMLDEVVERRGWISPEHFMHLVGVTNLLPGPNSSEVAIHIGYTQRGWRGALATGLTFLAPTLFMVTGLSAAYFAFGSLPLAEGIFWGLKPAILAVILSAGWKLVRAALESRKETGPPGTALLLLLAPFGIGVALLFAGWEVPAMALGGVLGRIFLRTPRETHEAPAIGKARSWVPFLYISGPTTTPLAAATPLLGTLGPLPQLFLLTLGSGAVLFGGGYMLVALLEPIVVESLGWLTPQQFLDGIALTQAVPGPIVTLVAFVGYGVAGVWGALTATAGIYLPSFAAVLLVAPHLERWRRVGEFRAALRGVNAVVAGAILGVGLTLLPPALPDPLAGALFLGSLLALTRFRVAAAWVVLAGLVAGFIHLLL